MVGGLLQRSCDRARIVASERSLLDIESIALARHLGRPLAALAMFLGATGSLGHRHLLHRPRVARKLRRYLSKLHARPRVVLRLCDLPQMPADVTCDSRR